MIELNKRLSEDDFYLVNFLGIMPKERIRIYFDGKTEQRQDYKKTIDTILNNQAIVEGLYSFIRHCDVMIESFESQLQDNSANVSEDFLEAQMDEWVRKKNDLTELIHYKTKNLSENIQTTNHSECSTEKDDAVN